MTGCLALRTALLAVVTTAISFLIGCGGGSSSTSIPSGNVSITPTSTSVAAGSAMQFTANTAVDWQVNGVSGGNSTTGTIDGSGFFQAPDLPMTSTVTVTAVSQADSTKTASATVNVTLSNSTADPLGTVGGTTTPVSCSQVLGGDLGSQAGTVTCYAPTISCPGVADEMVGIKVNAPSSGTTNGVITMTVGGGGNLYYDQHFTYGAQLVDNLVNNDGFTTVQTAWGFLPTGYPSNGVPAGWLSGPGGPRKLACRWATFAKWVHDNLRPSSTTPMCHTGNSGGSGAAAYALAHFGFDAMQIFNFLEETGGPPFVRIDQGCICAGPSLVDQCTGQSQSTCYGTNDSQSVIDPAYNPSGGHMCSQATSSNTTARMTLVNDSLVSPDANLTYPHTNIHMVFGDMDFGPEAPQATQWWLTMTPANGNQQRWTCANAMHEVPSFPDGIAKIEADLVASCH